ncbi:FHA domain-containing protein [Actinospica robiniae]|uniref:FHA domain-containing protein n=1 Tax=Actinospica robiniae TaxID=304901 RepID=UPI0004109997|nr:FHA domain-containing protein [Actinospica robiniae]
MAASSTRYRPGPWTAVVRPGVWLLAHSAPEDSVVERIWLALEQPEVETGALLAELVKANEGVADGGFAFVRSGAQATDVVVGGQGIAELIDSQGELKVFTVDEAAGGTTSALVDACAAIRLRSAVVAQAEISLPVDAAVVLASAIEYSAAEDRHPAPEPTAAEPIAPDPTVQESVPPTAEQQGSDARGENGSLDDSMESAGVLAANDLDWMTAGPAQPPAQPPAPQAAAEAGSGGWPEAQEEPVYAPPQQQDQYAVPWGAPEQPFPVYDEAMAQIPPPPGLLPAAEQTFATVHPDQAPGAALPMPQGPPILVGPPMLPAPSGPPIPQQGFAVTEPPQPGFGVSDQPLVAAVYCPYGHLTPAGSTQCRRCRTAVAPQEPFTITRPCLGRLRLSNGEIYPLDRDVVFGRRPEVPVGRPGPQPNAIALTDDRDVSRSHVEIRLDGWRVLAVDLGSVNGTQLAWPNLAPQPLPPRTELEIVPGCALILAPDVWIHFEEDL